MKDSAARVTLKALALGWFFATTATDRFIARRLGVTPYALGGDCARCAACCEAPAIRVSFFTWYFPLLRRVFLAWQAWVNGFVLVRAERAARTFVFSCTHFDREARRCDSYASRPGMCRDYPRVLLYASEPELLPGCGYRPVAPGAKRFLRVLDDQPLTDEQRERLKKDLYLE